MDGGGHLPRTPPPTRRTDGGAATQSTDDSATDDAANGAAGDMRHSGSAAEDVPPPPLLQVPGGDAERVRDRTQTRRRATLTAKEIEATRTGPDPDFDALAWLLVVGGRILDELVRHRILAPTADHDSQHEALEGAIFRARRMLDRQERLLQPAPASTAPAPPTAATRWSVPRPALPIFHGRPDEWASFWGLYEAAVHQDATITDIEKHVALRALLREQALAVVEGLAITADTYAVAIKLLRDRFDQADARRDMLLRRLLAMESLAGGDVATVRRRVDGLLATVRELEALGIDASKY